MCWLLQTSGYSYLRVAVIGINVHLAGKNPTNTTRMLPTPVQIRPAYASCGRSPYVANFCEMPIDLARSHCSWEKGLLTQSTARQLTNPWVHTQFLSRTRLWSWGRKPSSCRWPTIRFTGPISRHAIGTFNTCSRGPTERSLTDTGRGYNLRHTTPWPSRPAVSPFP
jgi:hypothetical protein